MPAQKRFLDNDDGDKDDQVNAVSTRTPPEKKQHELPPVPTTRDSAVPDISCYGEVVDIVVGGGPNQRTHIIHEGLLCFYSDYFRKALGGSFKEAIERRLVLEDMKPDTFDMFKEWLYTTKVHSLPWPPLKDRKLYIWRLIDICIFANRHLIPLLESEALTAMNRTFGVSPLVPAYIRQVYENVLPKSGLRRLFIDVCICKMFSGDKRAFVLEEHQEDWPIDALWDLAQAMALHAPKTEFERKQCFAQMDEDTYNSGETYNPGKTTNPDKTNNPGKTYNLGIPTELTVLYRNVLDCGLGGNIPKHPVLV